MKELKSIICITLFILFCCGCGDGNTPETPDNKASYARFLQKDLTVSGLAGVTMAMVEWLATEWEIAYGQGSIVTDISPLTGGNTTDVNRNVRVKITYSANSTMESRSQTIRITDKTTGEVSELKIEQGTEVSARYKEASVTVDVNTTYQHVVGFGGMYNPKIWLGSNLITSAEMNTMYGASGLGYSILRLMIYPNQSDWAADVAGAKIAQQNGAIIFACPWDCTDALADKAIRASDNKEVKHLKHENYAAYTDHIISYINYMKDNGVNLYAVSMQNEPDMSFTYWTPAEVVDYIKNYGARIRATGVKLMTPEACGFQPEYTDPVLNDAQAFAQTDIVAGHLYQGFLKVESGSYVKNRHDYICGLYNSKLAGAGKGGWWMTEHLYNDGESETDPAKWEFRTWDYSFSHLAKEIQMCMDGYCSAYVYWYLKRFYGMLGDNDNRSPVTNGEVSKCGYILSHYAKYATGKTRIKVACSNESVMVTAYKNTAGNEMTLVLLNFSEYDLNIQIPVSGAKAVSAVETTEDKNMQPVPTGNLTTGNGVYALIDGKSIVSIKIGL
jgi:glucuronoarabinoxylan endo-1,4-beta-xylanase